MVRKFAPKTRNPDNLSLFVKIEEIRDTENLSSALFFFRKIWRILFKTPRLKKAKTFPNSLWKQCSLVMWVKL